MTKIRLWTLGNLEHKIIPSQHMVNKLRHILNDNADKDELDLVWGPDLSLKCVDVGDEEVSDIIRCFDEDGNCTYYRVEEKQEDVDDAKKI